MAAPTAGRRGFSNPDWGAVQPAARGRSISFSFPSLASPIHPPAGFGLKIVQAKRGGPVRAPRLRLPSWCGQCRVLREPFLSGSTKASSQLGQDDGLAV